MNKLVFYKSVVTTVKEEKVEYDLPLYMSCNNEETWVRVTEVDGMYRTLRLVFEGSRLISLEDDYFSNDDLKGLYKYKSADSFNHMFTGVKSYIVALQ